MAKMNYKRKSSSSFLAALGSSGLWMGRRIEKLKEIQKEEPEFNYEDCNHLQITLDLFERTIKELKTIRINKTL